MSTVEPAQALSRGRRALSRQAILDAALDLVDEQGLGSLSMRVLGGALSVDPMAIYKHVESKDALLDGVAERLWARVELPEATDVDWKQRLRVISSSVRSLAASHPNAYPLLTSRGWMSESALRVSEAQLEVLEGAGFKRELAAQGVRALLSYAIGYGLMELSTLIDASDAEQNVSDVGRVIQIMQALPRDLPTGLVEVACTVCDCDLDQQFDFGLNLLIEGLESRAS